MVGVKVAVKPSMFLPTPVANFSTITPSVTVALTTSLVGVKFGTPLTPALQPVRSPPPSWAHSATAVLIESIAPWALAILRSEEHTSELQSHHDLVCRLLLEKKKKKTKTTQTKKKKKKKTKTTKNKKNK